MVTVSLDKGKRVDIVYTDFSKAFGIAKDFLKNLHRGTNKVWTKYRTDRLAGNYHLLGSKVCDQQHMCQL